MARAALAAALALAGAACGRNGAEAPPAERVAIPFPDPSGFDPRVRDELVQRRAALETAQRKAGLPAADLALTYGQAGMLYQAYGLVVPAEACYRNARALAPREMRWPYYLGQIYRKDAKGDQAAEALARTLELQPGYLPALLQLASLELDRGRPEQAEPLLQRALAVGGGASAAALFGLGRLASQRRDYAAAVRYFEQALQLAPDASEIHYPLALAYRNLGDTEKARVALERRGKKAVPLEDPLMQEVENLNNGGRVHHDRGTALFREGLFAEAVQELRLAAQATPSDPMVHVNLGSALTRAGDTDGARRAFAEALRLDPRSSMAHFNVGTLDAATGRDADAVAQYEAALATDPDLTGAHFNLANALRRLGRFDEAAKHYRRVVERDPRNADARLGEALALVSLARYVEAASRLEEGRRALPADRAIGQALARVLAAAPVAGVRDGQRALTLAQELVDQDRSLSNVVTLAMAAAEAGRFDVAVAWQSKAIDVVRGAKRDDLLGGLEEDLARYRRREACRKPWRDDDPALSARPARPLGATTRTAG